MVGSRFPVWCLHYQIRMLMTVPCALKNVIWQCTRHTGSLLLTSLFKKRFSFCKFYSLYFLKIRYFFLILIYLYFVLQFCKGWYLAPICSCKYSLKFLEKKAWWWFELAETFYFNSLYSVHFRLQLYTLIPTKCTSAHNHGLHRTKHGVIRT